MAVINPHLGYAEGGYEPTRFQPEYEPTLRGPAWVNEVGDAYMTAWQSRNYRVIRIIRELYNEEFKAFIYDPNLDKQ